MTGVADHFIDDAVWTVAGNYEIKLSKINTGWAITAFKFNLEKQSGDTTLPEKARQRAARLASA
jgi:hypothetical protein